MGGMHMGFVFFKRIPKPRHYDRRILHLPCTSLRIRSLETGHRNRVVSDALDDIGCAEAVSSSNSDKIDCIPDHICVGQWTRTTASTTPGARPKASPRAGYQFNAFTLRARSNQLSCIRFVG